MTRQPKTPRNSSQMLQAAPLGYRRRKKGRRAKSGQWWRRYPKAVLWGSDVGRCVDATIGESVRRERETRMALEDVPRAKTVDELKAQMAVVSRRVVDVNGTDAVHMRTNA